MEKLYSGLAGRWQSSFLAILHVYVFVIKMRYCQICVTVCLRLILGVVSFTDTLQVAGEINKEEFPAWTGGRSFRPMIAGAIPDTGQVFGEDGCLTRPSTPVSEEDKDQLIDAQPMVAGGSDQVSEDEDGAVIDPADNQPLGINSAGVPPQLNLTRSQCRPGRHDRSCQYTSSVLCSSPPGALWECSCNPSA